ncbi:MAG: exonuclease [Paracoccaceae bacterium]
MESAIVFDCEFLTTEGAQTRFWGGPHDPDPVVAQIGAVRISLSGSFPVIDQIRLYITPKDRCGQPCGLDPYFTALTGISAQDLGREGQPLEQALTRLCAFAQGTKLWSWGKDEFNLMAISCYVENITPPLPVTQFGNATTLLLQAGMPLGDVTRTRSSGLADYYHLPHPPLRAHDALDDALSIATVLQHLLRAGALKPADFL